MSNGKYGPRSDLSRARSRVAVALSPANVLAGRGGGGDDAAVLPAAREDELSPEQRAQMERLLRQHGGSKRGARWRAKQRQRLGETKVNQLERLAGQLKGNCEQLFGRLC